MKPIFLTYSLEQILNKLPSPFFYHFPISTYMESVLQSEVFVSWLFLFTVVRDALYGGFEEVSWAMILLVLFERFQWSFSK